ncbi:helix-turn-helix domain-containing protein [Rhizobium halophytocola]|uniref:Transcriptional regulator/transcriptional regulator with XRE-family HTH domain n=1 Tax=Rhizobium halophytocola TaxID=735519 RepID=A0ABS4E5H6_9HYPH|nr:XRE family transcriptional regulator [Rhizobium halophytocola]MBP1853201.1 putative transcriptional regulator/transcriptional regulator with XRE-family HTH domain [Rhizobium halophytocola]
MAETKIFAGPRLRRIRNRLELTQTAMAAELGISPSYLNLIERNQRPLTVQLLLKLVAVYRIEPEELQGVGGGVGQLREVFADPLIAAELPGEQELVEVAEIAPNVSAAITKLYRAYKEQAGRLSDLSAILAREGHETALAGTRLPIDEMRAVFERRAFVFSRLDAAAEAFHGRLQLSSPDELPAALKAYLKSEHGIVVSPVPAHVMPDLRRRFDRHSMRLFLSERLAPPDRLQELAAEVGLLVFAEEILRELEALKLSGSEARRLARFELARYAALALIMPLAAFGEAAVRLRYDVEALAARFCVSFAQAATRLASLARPGTSTIAFFLLEVDHAGNVLRKRGADGFPQAGFGGGCVKLGVHAALTQPGQVLADPIEMPDGQRFLTVSRTVEGQPGDFGDRVRRTALLLGCELEAGQSTVYGRAVKPLPLIAAGPACRLCERRGCLARAEPPVTRPLGLDDQVAGLSAFDFQ